MANTTNANEATEPSFTANNNIDLILCNESSEVKNCLGTLISSCSADGKFTVGHLMLSNFMGQWFGPDVAPSASSVARYRKNLSTVSK